jgi:hypothetical protein
MEARLKKCNGAVAAVTEVQRTDLTSLQEDFRRGVRANRSEIASRKGMLMHPQGYFAGGCLLDPRELGGRDVR